MALKLTYHASEFLFDIGKYSSILLEEFERFKERNKIVGDKFCERCLYAHMIKKAKELSIEECLIIKLKDKIGDKIGHYGYYLDCNNLITI